MKVKYAVCNREIYLAEGATGNYVFVELIQSNTRQKEATSVPTEGKGGGSKPQH